MQQLCLLASCSWDFCVCWRSVMVQSNQACGILSISSHLWMGSLYWSVRVAICQSHSAVDIWHDVCFFVCDGISWKKACSVDNRQPTEGGQNVPNSTKIKAGKFDCVEVTDELKRATLTQALVGSDKEKLMITSVSQSVCCVCGEFGKYFRVEWSKCICCAFSPKTLWGTVVYRWAPRDHCWMSTKNTVIILQI